MISWCLLTRLMHCYTLCMLNCWKLCAAPLYNLLVPSNPLIWTFILHCSWISWCLLTRLMDQLLPLARQPLLHSPTTLSTISYSALHWNPSDYTMQCTVEKDYNAVHSGEKFIRLQCSAQWREAFNGRVSLAGLDAVLPVSHWVQNKHCANWNI